MKVKRVTVSIQEIDRIWEEATGLPASQMERVMLAHFEKMRKDAESRLTKARSAAH